jgi:CheY-like chemotaxis protein
MHVRRLLLIDDDPDFQQLLEERLAPNGFEVVLPPDPTNPLGHVKDLRPSLIIISVELPDKVGYALCNKAKKGLARDIPVILTTRSVPGSGFRSHRKLKVHADEYIDKRAMTEEEVVAKVDQLVGLVGFARSSTEARPGYDDVDVEELDMVDLVEDSSLARAIISLDEDADDDDEISAVPREIAHEGGADFDSEDEFDPRELGADEDDDGSFEFGEPVRLGEDVMVPLRAATSREDGRNGGRSTGTTAAGTDPGRGMYAGAIFPEADLESEMDGFEADRTAVVAPFPILMNSPSARLGVAGPARPSHPTAPVDPAEESTPLAGPEIEQSAPVADLDLGLDQLASQAEEERPEVNDGRHQQRSAELEREVERLRAELEQARRGAGGGSSFSREREFLNLREVINKREKLILDLNDQLDGKERQILAEKERMRELERVRSDLDAKSLELEQSLLGASEELADLRAERSSLAEQLRRQTDALASVRGDAEQLSRLLERERASWREERDAMGRKHAAALDQQKHDMEAERSAAEQALRDRHGADLRSLKDAYEETSAEKDKGFGSAMALAEVRRQEELTAAQRGADERLQLELAEQRRRHQDELEALRREQGIELETLVRQSQEARQSLEDRQNAHIARLEEEQSQALVAAEKRRGSDVADADRRRLGELAELDERRRRELAAAEEERARSEAELAATFEAARSAMTREHAEERQRLEERLATREQELRERGDELAQTRHALRGLEEAVSSLQASLADRDERIGRLGQDLGELEQQNAGYQEQVLRAFQKIKADEATVARAKKAMAIALTLLDDAEQAAALEAAGHREE